MIRFHHLAAALVAGATLTAAGGADASFTSNGVKSNGTSINGIKTNGMSINGVKENGNAAGAVAAPELRGVTLPSGAVALIPQGNAPDHGAVRSRCSSPFAPQPFTPSGTCGLNAS
ncbi:hypothetical protein [Falsiroseomonas sp. HW251]|uniref:hypothetical protein n=1 Tax=Falsiroseomonas sp. HW251 TaxID=3390998 RepID=UPI003D310265